MPIYLLFLGATMCNGPVKSLNTGLGAYRAALQYDIRSTEEHTSSFECYDVVTWKYLTRYCNLLHQLR
jgi:hypothetical protein